MPTTSEANKASIDQPAVSSTDPPEHIECEIPNVANELVGIQVLCEKLSSLEPDLLKYDGPRSTWVAKKSLRYCIPKLLAKLRDIRPVDQNEQPSLTQ